MTDPSYQQLNDYTLYLQGQVQKFSAFMLTQKKLNEKHALIQNVVNEIMKKIQKVQDKLEIIEINEKENLYEMRKIRAEKQALKSMQIRIQNIQHEISSLFKPQSKLSIDQISQYESQKVIEEKPKALDKKSIRQQQNKSKNVAELSEQNLDFIEKYLSNVFLQKQEAQQMLQKTKEEIEFKIKKMQIQVQKSKESFLKLTSQINNLSNKNYFQSPFQKQSKGEKRLHTESTKDLNIEPISQENIITKKELKKMQKKLETFFSQKFNEIQSQNQNMQSPSNSNQKGLKFKRIQQKYDRLTAETTHQHPTRNERKIQIDDKKSSSQKKISLFDNQILRQRHGMRNLQVQAKSKQKRKSKNQIQSPLKLMEQPKHGKGFNSSRSQQKNITKRKSPDRLKKVNQDYMIYQ